MTGAATAPGNAPPGAQNPAPPNAPTAPADAAAAQGNRQQVQIDAARLQQLCKDLQGPKKLEFREAIAGDERVRVFRGKDFVRYFDEHPEEMTKWQEVFKFPAGAKFPEPPAAFLVNVLCQVKLAIKCDRASKKLREGQSKLPKWPKRVMVRQFDATYDPNMFYAWQVTPPASFSIWSIIVPVAVIGACLFPLSPVWAKKWLLWICYGLIGLILGTIGIRFVIWFVFWMLIGWHVWLLPNILDDSAVTLVEAFKPISISEEGTPRGTLLARAGVVGFGAVLAGFVKVYSLWAKGRVVNVGSGGIDSLIKANTARAAGFGGNADISGYLGGHVADVRAPYNPMMGATGGVFGGGSSTDFSDATLFAEVKQAQLEEKQRRERREARLREMADMRERGEEVDEEELRQLMAEERAAMEKIMDLDTILKLVQDTDGAGAGATGGAGDTGAGGDAVGTGDKATGAAGAGGAAPAPAAPKATGGVGAGASGGVQAPGGGAADGGSGAPKAVAKPAGTGTDAQAGTAAKAGTAGAPVRDSATATGGASKSTAGAFKSTAREGSAASPNAAGAGVQGAGTKDAAPAGGAAAGKTAGTPAPDASNTVNSAAAGTGSTATSAAPKAGNTATGAAPSAGKASGDAAPGAGNTSSSGTAGAGDAATIAARSAGDAATSTAAGAADAQGGQAKPSEGAGAQAGAASASAGQGSSTQPAAEKGGVSAAA